MIYLPCSSAKFSLEWQPFGSWREKDQFGPNSDSRSSSSDTVVKTKVMYACTVPFDPFRCLQYGNSASLLWRLARAYCDAHDLADGLEEKKALALSGNQSHSVLRLETRLRRRFVSLMTAWDLFIIWPFDCSWYVNFSFDGVWIILQSKKYLFSIFYLWFVVHVMWFAYHHLRVYAKNADTFYRPFYLTDQLLYTFDKTLN